MEPIILNQLKDSWILKQNELIQKRRPRRYLHFDKPIVKITEEIANEITNPELIKSHSFYPLFKSPIGNRIYKKDPKTNIKKIVWKDRPISYPSHYDSLIYSWYTYQLEFFYEKQIKDCGLDDNVIAYRKLGKSNIDFALEVFGFVKKKKECASLSLDIEGFYDNLDFDILKNSWKNNLGVKSLPDDHFNVFKSITRYSYIRRREIIKLKKSIAEIYPNKKFILNSKTLDFLRDNKKIKKNKAKGIPQGTPISCVLANLYMLPSDKAILNKINNLGGLYRRYSDDIIIICPQNKLAEIESFAKETIQGLKLKIQDSKTEKRLFKNNDNKFICIDEDDKNSRLNYLGIVLSSDDTYLRHKGYAKFERKMTKFIYKKVEEAKELKIPIFKRKIYERFSSFGKQNYVSYAKRAYKKINISHSKQQINFNRIMKKINKKISKVKSKK
ncbi:TPA: hypothetical protein DCX66_03625 [Candidatus Nomurabacteria bacterium]|uniref:Reverse transcriptase domain-containing protein n=1 Tax=Candidatus Nomurabacteria bacterium GW2011_GWE1_35_16 TaxID=1618761 RepID=A0A0G0BC57_9BACT|nr:MAG: hypothetical protein UR55_C0001G0023 [Candidatus Nomurabacteria bacterium GW2011_GWF1_34_20]KKP63732.1 MAG: hypothetical protein UR57_C0001G0023 [Candidatus Nomurabacteria bacterium GW2011_GWE2_34_25]KKP66944.1 MAG: hypothetical protein UR64_C0001G0023 [Candidatus Nomurabacteria bacterium GW2011_GWE1_35_16]HAE36768.1 hypothetical protein [Candidatus Nomurabacteria bacterium]HAX65529.1 hypothetical protein [Candidatus Nomurabacteria bacterium]